MRRLAVLVPAVLALGAGAAQARMSGWYDMTETVLSCHANRVDCSAFAPGSYPILWHVTGRGDTRHLTGYVDGTMHTGTLTRHRTTWVTAVRRHIRGCPSSHRRDIYVRSRLAVRESFGYMHGLVSVVSVARCPGRPTVVTRSRVLVFGYLVAN